MADLQAEYEWLNLELMKKIEMANEVYEIDSNSKELPTSYVYDID